ncbi:gephyrin-like molybdotransferase Glp [Fundidesulfovibrio terrae]|uniref:molybdopterin molybdotransferase MoeA n=1 Tax=Fundidesulfovibrio terrae TaxID=2922866 RepID=UPI001FAF5494|nr:gephyrin-like molybdotransferase Glp [Fundidesulfovibrio terrae]
MDKGYLELISSSAFREVLAESPPLPGTTVPLDEAAGRFLAGDVLSPEDLPRLPRSSMDGFAVRARDCFGATETNPSYLDLSGDLSITAVSAEPLAPGRCVRVVTGSSLPPGADAVVMVEHTQDLGAGTIEIRKAAAPGENMMLAGEDALAGQPVLAKGTLVRPAEIGLLAALGICEVPVGARPVAAILSTGDELVPVSDTPGPGSIRDANAPALAAMCAQAGAQPLQMGIVGDDVASIAQALTRALDVADAVFLSGGSSVGVRDLTIEALELLPDTKVLVHGLAVSPGKPTILARSRGKAVWGLPGQVASAQVVMFVFGCPFLAHLAGDAQAFTRPRAEVFARLARNVASRQGREDFVRMRLAPGSEGLPEAVPVLGKSGLLKTLVQAQGLAAIPAGLEGLEAGTTIRVMLL